MANNPYARYRYRLEIDGVGAAGFSEVTGYAKDVDAVEYHEGSMGSPVLTKMPSPPEYGNITLKWGMTNSVDLYNWMCPSFDSDVERKTAVIVMQSENNEDVAGWQLVNAWPYKVTAPEFSAEEPDVEIETLVLAHEGLTRTR